jgi:HAD superfamily hydrolase (TIGR01459 family)
MRLTSIDELFERYDAFLLDAYGVLVNQAGALPGAREFLERIERSGKSYLILTNDASRSVATIEARYNRFGLPISSRHIICSGELLVHYYEARGMAGARTIVLGTEDSRGFVLRAGGVPVPADDPSAEAVALCDDDGYELHQTLDDLITVVFSRLERGERTRLVLANPDRVFPRGEQAYGIASGSIALLIEAALDARHPEARLRFEPLGKPFAPMFELALERLRATDRRGLVMIGDQIATDIRGAHDFGLDSVLIGTGMTRIIDGKLAAAPEVAPTFLLNGLA